MRALSLSGLMAICLLGLAAFPAPAAVRAAPALYPAPTARQAVSILLADVTGRPIRTSCHPYQGTVTPAATLATCPITSRLRDAILRAPRDQNVVCRCENPPRQLTIYPSVGTGAGTFVEAYFDYGPGAFVTTYVLIYRSGGWLVDNMYCVRHPETSVYTTKGGLSCP